MFSAANLVNSRQVKCHILRNTSILSTRNSPGTLLTFRWPKDAWKRNSTEVVSSNPAKRKPRKSSSNRTIRDHIPMTSKGVSFISMTSQGLSFISMMSRALSATIPLSLLTFLTFTAKPFTKSSKRANLLSKQISNRKRKNATRNYSELSNFNLSKSM